VDMKDTRLMRENAPEPWRSNEDRPRLALVGVIDNAISSRRNLCHSIEDIGYQWAKNSDSPFKTHFAGFKVKVE
jgi:hypothetical protein